MTPPANRFVLATIVCTAVPLAGCSGKAGAATYQPTPGSTAATTSVPRAADVGAAETIGLAVARASVTWDTATDRTETAGIRRVLADLTPKLGATVVEPARSGGGQYWVKAASAAAASQPKVVPLVGGLDAPPDTSDQIHRAYAATWDWVSCGGASWPDPRTRTIYLTIQFQPSGGWLVSTYDYSEPEGST